MMRGYGSGRHGWRHRVEHYPAIRVRDLRKALGVRWCDLGTQVASGEISWRFDEDVVKAMVVLRTDSLEVNFADPMSFYSARLSVVHRPRGFGGRSSFFVCP